MCDAGFLPTVTTSHWQQRTSVLTRFSWFLAAIFCSSSAPFFMYLTSSTGLILYSSEWQKKGGIYYNAEKCQQSQSHVLDPCSCSLYSGSSGTIWKKHARASWVPLSRCPALSAPQTLSSEHILDKKEALPLLEVSRIQTHGKTSHIRRLGRMSSFIPGDALSRVPRAEISALCSHLSFSPLSNTVLLLMFMTIELYWWSNKTNWKLNFFFLRALTLNSNSLHAWASWVSFRRCPAITI